MLRQCQQSSCIAGHSNDCTNGRLEVLLQALHSQSCAQGLSTPHKKGDGNPVMHEFVQYRIPGVCRLERVSNHTSARARTAQDDVLTERQVMNAVV